MAVVYLGNSMQRVFVIPSAVAKDGTVRGSVAVNPAQVVEVDKELIEHNKKHSKPFKALLDGNFIVIDSKPFRINEKTLFNPQPKGAPSTLDLDDSVERRGVKTITAERSNDVPAGKQGGV